MIKTEKDCMRSTPKLNKLSLQMASTINLESIITRYPKIELSRADKMNKLRNFY